MGLGEGVTLSSVEPWGRVLRGCHIGLRTVKSEVQRALWSQGVENRSMRRVQYG